MSYFPQPEFLSWTMLDQKPAPASPNSQFCCLQLHSCKNRDFLLIFPEGGTPSARFQEAPPAGSSCRLKPAHLTTPPGTSAWLQPGLVTTETSTLRVFTSKSNMARINSLLKCLFISFNVLFAIVGGVIIGLAVLSQTLISAQVGQDVEGRAAGLIVLYVIGIVTMVIAIIGACGAQKESKGCLIVFLVCMVIGSLLMLRSGIPAAIGRPKMAGVLEDKFRQLLPLDQAGYDVKQMADTVQTQMHCCGLFSYKDWEDNIPESCVCSEMEEEEYQCREVNYRDLFQMKTKSIYSKPCFPIIKDYVLMAVDIGLGVVFFLAALAVLGMILSSVMIHQLRHPDRPTILLTVPTIFTAGPPKYQELHNPPPPY